MPSYVITGVSRGLGWEFLKQISCDPADTVIGIVRNKPATEKRVAEELSDRHNITILEADITNYDHLKRVAAESAALTGGSLDYLIANAAHLTSLDSYDGLGTIAKKPKEITFDFMKMMETNVLANIFLYDLFLPQIMAGDVKKVIAISSGVADNDWTNECSITATSLNAISKAAMNVVTAKFHVQYREQRVLFLGVCPGFVDVGHFVEPTRDQAVTLQKMIAKFTEYSPSFKGPASPVDSVKDVLSVIRNASLEKGDGGQLLSHFGNKRWL
ncbi:NAD(P)-binding protein [Astrocystis sublimbata]|nr:NAD(P)-binding protein [Astrocystis sublimbata]